MARLLFLGTAPIAVPALRACYALDEVELLAVVSQPPSRRGRGRRLQPSATHQAALELGLEVRTPTRFRGEQGDAVLDEFEPDACLVMAYGQIITAAHLERCPDRWLNLHGSLLPRWRGAAPIERCLEAGDVETGVQLMVMEAGLDTGPVLGERRVATAGHNAESLAQVLAVEAAALTTSHLSGALRGELTETPQDNDLAVYAHRIQRHEGQINFLGHAEVWARKARAFDPRLGLRCRLLRAQQAIGLKIWSAEPLALEHTEIPGTILRCDTEGLWVACETGALNVLRLQLDGKKRLTWQQVRAGLSITPQDRFEA